MADENQGYGKDFSDQGFWDKAISTAKTAGKDLVEKALLLYYALQNSETPLWAKTVVVGALGYFINPMDAIPDLVPVVGLSDDLGVLTMAVASLGTLLGDDVKAKAVSKLNEWFPE